MKFDPEQKGTLLGKGGSTINRIQTESGGAVLELGKGDDCTVKISGPNTAVLRARKALAELLHLDAKSVKVVELPGEIMDATIGKGGENIRRLESAHGVSIDFNRSGPRTEPCKLKLRGSVEGVKDAMTELEALIERERRTEEAVEVESQHIGMLLGKGGATINAIQRETGAVLDIQKRANEGSSTQTVTVKGNKVTVRKATAALEAVLQYKAEGHEVLTVDPRMMPLLIGKGGEEINRIRSATGAAIDAERDSDKPRFKIRGSVDAVAKAKQAILDSIDSNKMTGESVVLPWHAIDVLLGPNAKALARLEADFNVQIELPGQSLASEQVGAGSFLGISSSMSLRGRKKFIEAASAEISRISRLHDVEHLELDGEDASLLARLCLDTETLLDELGERQKVKISFAPLEGTLTIRGEDTLEARIELRQMLAKERFTQVLSTPQLLFSSGWQDERARVN